MSRKIYLFDDLDHTSAKLVIKEIHKLNEEDDNSSTVERKPIELYIFSGGGSTYAGLALCDTIKNSITSIHTYGLGLIGSAALDVFMSGHKRLAGARSTFLYHSGSWNAEGVIEEIKARHDELLRLQKIADQIILDRTKISEDKLKEIVKLRMDWRFGADEALELGVIDEII